MGKVKVFGVKGAVELIHISASQNDSLTQR